MNDYKHSHTDARWLQFFSIMGIPNEKSTLEALNNYQGYDVVVREMISKEIDRQYSFMKWNIVVQTFLFGAITQLKNDKYLWVIIVIGLLASISSFITYWASEAKIKRILYFWDGYRKFKGLSYFAFPPVWTNPTEDTIPETEVKEIFGEYKLGWSRKLCLKLILPKRRNFAQYFNKQSLGFVLSAQSYCGGESLVGMLSAVGKQVLWRRIMADETWEAQVFGKNKKGK